MAFVATRGSAIVGVGRLERLPASTDAEVAFVVADDHQRQGLGTRLLERLERRRPATRRHPLRGRHPLLQHRHAPRAPPAERLLRAVRGRRCPRAVPDRGSAFGARAWDLRLLCSGGQIRTFDIDLNAQELTMTTITRDPVVTTTGHSIHPDRADGGAQASHHRHRVRRCRRRPRHGPRGRRRAPHLGRQLLQGLRQRRAELPEHRLPARRRPGGRGSHRPAARSPGTPSTPAPRPRPTPASSTATSKASPTAPPSPTSATPSGPPTPPSRRRPPTAPAPPRSPSCKARPTPSPASGTPSSRVRRCEACC